MENNLWPQWPTLEAVSVTASASQSLPRSKQKVCQSYRLWVSIVSFVIFKKKNGQIRTHAVCMSLESPPYNSTAEGKRKSRSNTAVLSACLAFLGCSVTAKCVLLLVLRGRAGLIFPITYYYKYSPVHYLLSEATTVHNTTERHPHGTRKECFSQLIANS